MLCILKCDYDVRPKICRGTYVVINKLVTKSYKIIFKRMMTYSLNLASVTTLYELCDYEPVFGINSGCDCHFSGDNLIIQKERFL